MKQICTVSGREFEISDEDLEFYRKVKVPPPTLCPDERQRRRLAWRNERNIYQRKCDLCDKSMISVFPADSSLKVYCQDCWWSDKWDAQKYARDYNFDRPFFDQFQELLREVPMVGLINATKTLVNSEYSCYTADAKNCYLCFACNYLEDCMYSEYIWESRDTLDCSHSTQLELCYECIDCDNLFNCKYLQDSKGCNDCTLGLGLINCSNCFGCVNLNNKKFHFFNEKLTEEEYKEKIAKLNPQEEIKRFREFSLRFPRKFSHQINCENSTGDAIKNCKNVQHCFDGYGGEDLKWLNNFPGETKDCYDIAGCAKNELGYECHAIFPGYNIQFSNGILNGGSDIMYSAYLGNSRDLFGCIGLKKAQYCILNKQYSKEEYEALIPRIIEHMTKTGEFGEFFPISIAPFAYNETVAQEWLPLTKEEVINRGYRWREKDHREYKPATAEVLACSDCGKNYKIAPKESQFYEKLSLPNPAKCPSCRHSDRMSSRPPRKIHKRLCAKCQAPIATVYSKDRPEIVYCGKCYLNEVY